MDKDLAECLSHPKTKLSDLKQCVTNTHEDLEKIEKLFQSNITKITQGNNHLIHLFI